MPRFGHGLLAHIMPQLDPAVGEDGPVDHFEVHPCGDLAQRRRGIEHPQARKLSAPLRQAGPELPPGLHP